MPTPKFIRYNSKNCTWIVEFHETPNYQYVYDWLTGIFLTCRMGPAHPNYMLADRSFNIVKYGVPA